MPELQMDVSVANRFISSLSKSLQALCHGCMDFDSGIEIVGYINVNIDSGSKVDYVLNEKVLKSTTNSMTFVSNSFLAKKDQLKQTRDGACSPISELKNQSQTASPHRIRGAFHGSQPRMTPPFSHSYVLHGSQKRSWPGMDRDWRMSPKKQKMPREGSPSGSQYSQMPSTSNQNQTDSNFKWPTAPTSSSIKDSSSGDGEADINIKKEVNDSDNEITTANEQETILSSDQETNDQSDKTIETAMINIKRDPDAVTPSADSDSADFKGTFLQPSSSDENQQSKESTDNQANENDETSSVKLSASEQTVSQKLASASSEEAPESTANADSEATVDYDDAGDDGAYPQSVYSDAGEGASESGQFEVIEIDDEDEDVQAMFGESHYTQDCTFDSPKGISSRDHVIKIGHRFSFKKTIYKSLQNALPSTEGQPFALTRIQIPSKDDCPFDPTTHRYICPVCKNTYLTYSSVCNHIKFKHQGLYEAYCDICGKGFQRRIHLQGHMAVHGQPMNFECSFCGSKYAHKSSLRAHEKLIHGIM